MPRKPAARLPVTLRGRARVSLRGRVEVAKVDATDATKPRTFRMVANTGEPMNLWPYDMPVVVDMDTIDCSGLPVPALYDHSTYGIENIVGLVESAGLVNGEFVASGRFTPTEDEHDKSRQVLAKADAGHIWQTSIGGNPTSVEEIKAGNSVVVNGRTYAGPICVARGVVLREISFVVLGGDRRTSAVVARHRRILLKGSAMSFEDWLTSMGFDSEAQKAMTEIQLANMQKMYADESAEGDLEDTDTEGAPDDPATPPTNADDATPFDDKVDAADDTTDDVPVVPAPSNAAAKPVKVKAGAKPTLTAAQAVAAERGRVSTISKLCGEHGNPKVKAGGKKVGLLAHALTAGWSVDQVKSHLLNAKRQARPTGPNVIIKSHDKDCNLQALQGAMIVRFGGKLNASAYQGPQAVAMGIPQWLRAGVNDAGKNRIMEAAHKYSDMSAVDLCREACRIDGKTPGHGRQATIQAAFSGSSLTNVFTTNVNAILLASYFEIGDTTAGWVTENDVADYQLQERPRVVVGQGLTKLPRGGTADHAKFADVSESYRIARYAQMFQLDEMDIINDRLGALGETPMKMGQAAAWLRPDLVYAHMLANPTLAATAIALFSASNESANLLTTAALSAAKLKAAVSAQSLFRENGRNLNLKTTHLIVPPTLIYTARELVTSSSIVIAGTAGSVTERGTDNTLKTDNLTIISDARLENGVVDPDSGTTYSGSSSTWFLASIWAQTIEVGYLRGSGRAPQVRPFMLDKGKFGIGWDVQHAIGVKALDWRGLLKNTA